jgi:hypothetical protein
MGVIDAEFKPFKQFKAFKPFSNRSGSRRLLNSNVSIVAPPPLILPRDAGEEEGGGLNGLNDLNVLNEPDTA